MADFQFPLLRFLLLLLLASLVFSRELPITSTTAILEVSTAISNAQQLFSQVLHSKRDVQHLDDAAVPSSSAALSFPLHTRFSVGAATLENDYKALSLSRLARDSSRVRAIQTRVDLARFGITKADLTPLDETTVQLTADRLEGPVVSGTTQGSGEYFCRVGIGKPATQAYMVLDTGSDINWVQCAPCSDCYQQADPIFNPALSSSFSALNCDAHQCKSLDVSECRNNTCMYQVSYGDGSYTVGDFATETITLGTSTAVNDVAIGCGHNNEGLFVAAAGLLGLGGGELSFPSQINASSFSYCLVDRDSDSASTLDFNSPPPPDAVTSPVLRNSKLNTFYYVDITGIKVGGEPVPIPSSTFQFDHTGAGGVIVDSGTAVTRLPTAAYDAVRDAFKKGMKDLTLTDGVALFDTCYDLKSMKSVEVPTLSFQFSNGKEFDLPAKNYMVPVDSSGTFCLALAGTSSSPGIIGNVQQQGTRVSYDLANNLIGFSPNKC